MQCSKNPSLFDHLVGDGEQGRWNFEVERFRRRGVYHQLELGIDCA
jgi:hypothetical protein